MRWLALLVMALITTGGSAQVHQPDSALELTISVNRTAATGANSVNGFGFGGSVHYLFNRAGRVNVVAGLELFSTNQVRKNVLVVSKFGGPLQDIHFNFYGCCLPVMARINLGHKSIWVAEAGAFVNLGGLRNYPVNTNPSGPNNIGLAAGAGIKIPAGRKKIICKLEYRHAIGHNDYYAEKIFNRYYRLAVGINI